jgi:membrane-associated protease RseP (regulator of RpoE activity)
VTRAFLGVHLDSKFTADTAARIGLPRVQGARVSGITPNSPAALSKLTVGDVILQFDGVPIEDDNHLVNQVSLTPVGKDIPVVVFRQGKSVSLKAVRNTTDYEVALYLAGAAVHHALAEVEQNPTWTTGIPATEFPAGSGRTYSATIAAGLDNTIIVTGVGTAGATTRRLEVTVSTQG